MSLLLTSGRYLTTCLSQIVENTYENKIKEAAAQTYSREKVFLEIFKNTFSCRTPPMAASEIMNTFVDVSLFFRE